MSVLIKREKIFGMPQSFSLDREAKIRLKMFARGWSAAHRQPGQHKGPITRTYLDVLWALMDFAHKKTGFCFPSLEAIAGKTGCHRDTVLEAIKMLEFAGVLRVFTRLVRAGGRVLWTSNAYVFRAMAPKPEIPGGNKTLKDSRSSFLQTEVKNSVKGPVDNFDGMGKGLLKALHRLGSTIAEMEELTVDKETGLA